MSDINCPMCGKRNPAGSEVCPFCQARIQPLTVGSPSDELLSVDSTSIQNPDIPGWLASLRQPAQDGSAPEEPSPAASDWLNDLRNESREEKLGGQKELEPGELDGSEVSAERQLPEWLRGLLPVEESTVAAAARTGEEDLIAEEPEWLLNNKAEESLTSSQEAELLDWFSSAEPDLAKDAAADKAESTHQELSGNDDLSSISIEWPPRQDEQEVLDWLDRPRRAVESGNMGEKEVSKDFSQEMPSWFSELEREEQDQDERFNPSESIDMSDGSVGELANEPSDEITAKREPELFISQELEKDFLLGGENEPLPDQEPVTAFGMEVDQTGDLSWLDDLGTSVPGLEVGSEEGERIEVEPVASEEPAGDLSLASALPAWSSESELEISQIEGESQDLSDEDQVPLTPAELPSWLKAMRPVAVYDAVAGGSEPEESGMISSVGPLAGLRGVLPAEPDVAQVMKPSVYSTGLHFSDVHQTHANLLAELIEAEGEVKPISPAPVLTSQGLLRILIFIGLFAVILFSILTGAPAPQKPKFTPEVFAVSQLIIGIPAGAPVLVAIDYSPGFSGEVGAILEAVVDHLASNNAFITFVSTKPEGPLQAELILENLKQRNLMPASVNLGYVPGGMTGVLAFSLDPQSTLPKDIRAQSVWDSQPLQSIETLSDFDAIIIAAENPDIARNWIEQTQPFRKETPMILVISAQTEPLIRPYYEASPRQIQGLLVGYPAAVIYETILGNSNQTTDRWPPFAAGLGAGVLLIALGIVVNSILGAVSRSKENKRAREQP